LGNVTAQNEAYLNSIVAHHPIGIASAGAIAGMIVQVVLMPDPAKQVGTKLQQGEKLRQALSELNLTADQNTQVKTIFKAARAKHPHQEPTPSSSPQ
jgi:Spy/CpxP family protein refolding chaperone